MKRCTGQIRDDLLDYYEVSHCLLECQATYSIRSSEGKRKNKKTLKKGQKDLSFPVFLLLSFFLLGLLKRIFTIIQGYADITTTVILNCTILASCIL